jgi:hypothetical protein
MKITKHILLAAFIGGLFHNVALFAQHDSLSCIAVEKALNSKKTEMQSWLEFKQAEFDKRLPEYTERFNAFLDSLDEFGLWRFVSDPLELKAEKARLDLYNDHSQDKRVARHSLEIAIFELRKGELSKHKIQLGELSNYLGSIYSANGDERSTATYTEGLNALVESRKVSMPSQLELQIRTKLANAFISEPQKAQSYIEIIKSLNIQDSLGKGELLAPELGHRRRHPRPGGNRLQNNGRIRPTARTSTWPISRSSRKAFLIRSSGKPSPMMN